MREYHPAALTAFHGRTTLGLDSTHARVVLTAAATPTAARRLTRNQLRALLNRAGRLRRSVDEEIERLRATFRAEQQLPMVEEALGRQTAALLQQLDATCRSVDDLAAAPQNYS